MNIILLIVSIHLILTTEIISYFEIKQYGKLIFHEMYTPHL